MRGIVSELASAIVLCCMLLPSPTIATEREAPFVLATYNLRLNTPQDGINAWPHRRDAVKALIRYHAFDVFGTQEGLPEQLADLATMDEFAHVGAGRDDGKHAGEHAAIFYRKSRFTVLQNADFWLSETPDRPSLGWDAKCCNRIVSWVQLRDQDSGRTFFVFSAHFDHEGVVARRESAKLLVQRIAAIAGDAPVLCVGDFNATPESEPIATLRTALRDARDISAAPPYGPAGTFNGFQPGTAASARIDYIFVSRGVRVLRHAVLTDSLPGRYPSDHFPVVATIVFE